MDSELTRRGCLGLGALHIGIQPFMSEEQGKFIGINTRFEADVAEALEAFCEKTHRSRTDVIRAAVKLLLKDGEHAAELRLAQGVWESADVEMIAMKETMPTSGGRQIVVFTPGRHGDASTAQTLPKGLSERLLRELEGKKRRESG